MRDFARSAAIFLLAIIVASWSTHANAEIWIDPESPLTWDGALASELVVLARYESHQDKTVTLTVLEVLKGAPARKTLVVELQHLYTLETGPVGWEAFGNEKKPGDGVPKLCYQTQIINPGGLVPMPIRKDAREPALYFFADSAKPTLKIRGQIQSPLLKMGWQQALDDKPMELLFRLTQHINGELSRDALEELGRTRDGRCLDQLFVWIADPPSDEEHLSSQSATYLSRLGDRDGDVYDRARKRMADAAPGASPYRFYSLATIMSIVDQDRAWTDLPQLAGEESPLLVRKGALSGIGRIPKREAAELALKMLRVTNLAETALGAVQRLLQGEEHYGYPRFRGLPGDPSWLVDELRKAAQDERIPERTRKEITQYLLYVPLADVTVDLDALRHELLNSESTIYRGLIENRTEKLLRDAKQACDPRVIPILAEALDTVPKASGHHSYSLPELLTHYALICPQKTRKELEKRGVPARLATIPSSDRNHKIHEAMETAGLWAPRYPIRNADETATFRRLALKVRGGNLDAVDELLEAADKLFEKRSYKGLSALLDADAPEAEARFLSYVKRKKQTRLNQFSHELQIDLDLTYVLDALYPGHPDVFAEQILELLQSKSLAERKKGADILVFTLQSDLDFDPVALELDRTRQLAEIEPLLRRLGQVSEQQARVILLERSGYSVRGEPNESWLPTLIDAVGSRGNAAPHALRLLETVVEEQRPRKFEHFPPPERQRAVRAYLSDMGKHPKP